MKLKFNKTQMKLAARAARHYGRDVIPAIRENEPGITKNHDEWRQPPYLDRSCPLCKKYNDNRSCPLCPLSQAGYHCANPDGLWEKMENATEEGNRIRAEQFAHKIMAVLRWIAGERKTKPRV